MDPIHHPSSSTPTTTKEEEDLSHDDKRAKTHASSSSAAITDHGVETLPLPLAAPLHFYSLPDIAHDAIASYLTMKDMHCMMESSLWLLKAYGGRVKDLRLPMSQGLQSTTATMALALSVMSRRPGLVQVTVRTDETMGVVAEAMRKGYCDKLEVLSLEWSGSGSNHFRPLCDALADGRCSKISALVVASIGDLVPLMGTALQSRMGKGCCGLKSLEIRAGVSSLSPLLSSGACDSLEELKVEEMEANTRRDLSEWLLRTKAPRLRVMAYLEMDPDLAHALCSPGVAPKLQVLDLDIVDAYALSSLSQAVGGGAWPHLKDLKIWLSVNDYKSLLYLIEAIGLGTRELTTLQLGGNGLGCEGGMAVARVLKGGGCPRLEELDLSYTDMGDGAVVELAKALNGEAPCNTTLRRLDLDSSDVTSVGVRELMESMGRGALPYLEYLNLDSNSIMDDGVVALAGAMSGGSLRCLQELHLRSVGMDQRGAKALFQALRDHTPCPHLKKLNLRWNQIGDDGMAHLAEAIEAGALQHLRELDASNMDMGEKGFKSLVKAIVAQEPNPGCPRLEVLGVNDNESIGDGGVMYLAEAMENGAMQHLRDIKLRGVGMSMEGAKALLKTLGDCHACPNLEGLGLKGGYGQDKNGIDLGWDDCGTSAHAQRVRELTRGFMCARSQHRHCSRVKIF